MGKILIQLYIEEFVLDVPFYVVDDDIPIPVDGLLGRVFLKGFKSAVDYRDNVLRLRLDREVDIPLLDDDEFDLVLPPRSEVIRSIKTNITEDSVVFSKEIEQGVFIANSIIEPKNSFIKIINTTPCTKILKNLSFHSEPLNNFYTFIVKDTPPERTQKLLDILKDKFPKQAPKKLSKLCSDFADIFALEDDPITVNNFYEQKLTLTDDIPVCRKQYKTPRAHKVEIKKQVKKLLKNKIIQNSVSPYNNPIILVPKGHAQDPKDRKWRLVVDFRELNKKLIPDKFPLPRIDEILDQLGKAKYFSVIDLISGFHQIPLHQDSRKYTAFSCDSGFYEFTRLPFGLSVSPNSFSRMMAIAFSGLTPEKAFLYIDDLIVIGINEEHHLNNLKDVFEVCTLKLNPTKCQFFKSEVTYLGHHLTDKGILPDKSKYVAIEDYPTPKTADEAKRFVAFCNYYRRFIRNFAELAYPLNRLTRKNQKFEWTDLCEEAFQELKKALLNPPILKYPDFSKQFTVITDASNIACGAILAQEYDGLDHPIAYASRTLTKGEMNKSTIEKELAAIHWALQHFKAYLYGTKFKVKSDHRPLVYLFNMTNPTSKLTRMRMDLEDFDFIVEYIKGEKNVGADALSRIDISDLRNTFKVAIMTRSKSRQITKDKDQNELNEQEVSKIKIYELSNPQMNNDPELKFELSNDFLQVGRCIVGLNLNNYKKASVMINFDISRILKEFKKGARQVRKEIFKMAIEEILSKLETESENVNISQVRIYDNDDIFAYLSKQEFKEASKYLNKLQIAIIKSPTLVVDLNVRNDLLRKFHDDPLIGGHCGAQRMYTKMKYYYKWPKMRQEIKNYVQKCKKCQLNKASAKNKPMTVITDTPQKAFDLVTIDTVGPLPATPEGYRYLLTIQCELSKYVVAGPMIDKSANSVAKCMFDHFIYIHGFMRGIRTDKGTEYVNQIFKELTDICGIKHQTSVPYHPQTIGGLERNHRVLNEFLRQYIDETFTNWAELIRYYVFAWNSTPNEQVGDYTPYELVYANKPNLPQFLLGTRIDPLYNVENYAKELKFKLQTAQKRARDYLLKVKELRMHSTNRKASSIPLKIGDLVKVRDEARHKLNPWFKGPFEIVGLTPTNCTIRNFDNTMSEIHLDRVKKFNA